MGKRNITVTVDEEAYRRGRIWAAERQTSISAVVAYLIAHLPGQPVACCAAEAIQDQRKTNRDRSSSPGSNSIASLTRAIDRISGQLSAPQKNKEMHCETVQSSATGQSQ